MLENINLALQGVWSHKLRSFLTMLGIIIGIAAIITIVSTIRGTNEQIKQNLIGAGNDMVQVQLTQDGSVVDLSYGEIPEGIATITSAMRDEMDALPGVSAVAMYHQRTWADGIYAGNNSFTGTLNGVDDHYLSVAGYQVNYGRAFLPEDFSSCRKVAVIGGSSEPVSRTEPHRRRHRDAGRTLHRGGRGEPEGHLPAGHQQCRGLSDVRPHHLRHRDDPGELLAHRLPLRRAYERGGAGLLHQ